MRTSASPGVGGGVGDGDGVGFLVGFGVGGAVGGSVGGVVGAMVGGSDAGVIVAGPMVAGTTGRLGRVRDGNTLEPGNGVMGVTMKGVEFGATLVHAATATVMGTSSASLVTRT